MSNKLIRYLIEAIIIFCIIRYFLPKEYKLNVTQAIIATIIVLILSIIMERLILSYLDKKSTVPEKFNDKKKQDKKIEPDKKNIFDDLNTNEAFSGHSTNTTNDISTNFSSYKTDVDQLWYNGHYSKDEDKTNVLPMPSDYEHSYSFLSSESSN